MNQLKSPLLKIDNLQTQFKTSEGIIKAANNVSFEIYPGEIIGVVGESGCGKSVTALSIMQLIPKPHGEITSGKILYRDTNILTLKEKEMQKIRGKEISIIFQEPMTSLNPVLTIEKQLTEQMLLHLKLNYKDAYLKAIELLEMVGMPDPKSILKKHPHNLSGGMRQRIMIAIAISCNPKLIIADEPTTSLDVTIQAQILETLKSLCQTSNTALILITHNLGIIARYAKRVIVMYAGKIIEEGNSVDIYHNPKHPYTLGLLKSIPKLNNSPNVKLESIPGNPPDLNNLPSGCSFQSRCFLANEKCKLEPTITNISEQHWSACWNHAELNGFQI